MTKFGLLSPSSAGHLDPMLCIGQELKRRGHSVTQIGVLRTKANALAAGLEFQVSETDASLDKRLVESGRRLSKLSGTRALKQTLAIYMERIGTLLRYAPQSVINAGVDALLIDQTLPIGTIADSLKIPFVTICSAMAIIPDVCIPPHFTSWKYNPAPWARLRNLACYAYYHYLTGNIRRMVTEYRRKCNLPPYSGHSSVVSQLAEICQQPAEFDFPRKDLSEWFHFVGPYQRLKSIDPASFPWEKLNGKPLIYASMGTVQNRILDVFYKIAAACRGLDVQLVISLGKEASLDALADLPGDPLVFDYVPQLELLKRVTLTITHAGMNTTLGCLSNAVPMVAIPISNEQPGIAARIAWTGTGEMIPLRLLTVPRLRREISKVLARPSYKQNALRLQKAIERAGGVTRAADIIEQAVSTGKPVLK